MSISINNKNNNCVSGQSYHLNHKFKLTIQLISLQLINQQVLQFNCNSKYKIPQLQKYKSIDIKLSNNIIKFNRLKCFKNNQTPLNNGFLVQENQYIKNDIIDIQFSPILNKYYPVKSLIKLYEDEQPFNKKRKNQDNNLNLYQIYQKELIYARSQITLGVSGISTEQLINQMTIKYNNKTKKKYTQKNFKQKINQHQSKSIELITGQTIMQKTVANYKIILKIKLTKIINQKYSQALNQTHSIQSTIFRSNKSLLKKSQSDKIIIEQKSVLDSQVQSYENKYTNNFKKSKQNQLPLNLNLNEINIQNQKQSLDKVNTPSFTFKSNTFGNDNFQDFLKQQEPFRTLNHYRSQSIIIKDKYFSASPRSTIRQQTSQKKRQHLFGQCFSMKSQSISQNQGIYYHLNNNPQQLQQQITYYQQQIDVIGNQLIEERRKFAKLQEKILKLSRKSNNLKRQNNTLKSELNQYIEQFQILSDNISNCENIGKNFQVDQKHKKLSIIYYKDAFVEKFKNFLSFIKQKLEEHSEYTSKVKLKVKNSSKKNQKYFCSSLINKISTQNNDLKQIKAKQNPKLKKNQEQAKKLKEQCQILNHQLQQLKNQLKLKEAQIQQAYILLQQKNVQINLKNDQIQILYISSKDLQDIKGQVDQQVNLLKQKIQNLLNINFLKDQTIKHFDKVINQQKIKIESLQLQHQKFQKMLQNYNIIYQNKQQIANLYLKLQKFGQQQDDLKQTHYQDKKLSSQSIQNQTQLQS